MPEMMVVGVIALLLFGKRLPEVARSLGKGMREFKESVTGEAKDDEATSLPPAEPVPPAAAAPAEQRERDTVS